MAMKRMPSWWRNPCWFAIVAIIGTALVGCDGLESPRTVPTGDIFTSLAPTVTTAPLVTETNPESEILFETIERADLSGTGVYYEGTQPKLDVIASAQAVDVLDGTISPDVQAQLLAVDFSEYLVFAAFQGWRPSLPTPSGVEVQRITWDENTSTITINVHLYEPVEGSVSKDVVISAYHVVKIEKTEKMRGEMEFVLEVDGAAVGEQTVLLP